VQELLHDGVLSSGFAAAMIRQEKLEEKGKEVAFSSGWNMPSLRNTSGLLLPPFLFNFSYTVHDGEE
jgi:hypothetical protein